MEKKRKPFPRFYFLSDDELIDILANSRDLKIIQGHLKACFDNLVALTIGDDEIIEKIHSSEKEVLKLKKPTRTKDVIEVWLKNLQINIRDTLFNYLKEGIKDYGNQLRPVFVRSHYGQIVAAIAQIMWC
jgi:dynein heavy chain